MQDIDIEKILDDPNFLMIILLGISLLLFLIEGYKFVKYKTKSDIMDMSMLAVIFLFSFIVFDDLYLSFLAIVFFLMVIGTYELRESPVWVRLMASFTITYGYLLVAVLIENILDILIENGSMTLPSWLGKTSQISGIALSTTLWVLLICSFAFFGKRFILVSRFLSPQYVYLFLYGLVYVIIISFNTIYIDYLIYFSIKEISWEFSYLIFININGIPWEYRYLGLFLANFFLYMISGWLLTFIFRIKPLKDERALNLVSQVEGKIDTKIRSVGIVEAPILNAFAYGPFFDQRFAFIIKDINDFSDEELLGITAHEISHLKGKHTFWLLWIGFIDLFLKFLLGIPASSYDIAAGITDWNLFDYYIVNMLFFALALFFVRFMEGNADKRTKEIGYGDELAQALYRLEGYYRGIAGELGLNAQLLMDSSRTDIENARFTGEAAIDMHNRLLNPPRYGLFMNLIVSHPPTPFRIAAIVSDDISTIRLAMMPVLLILPIIRKRNLKLLANTQTETKFTNILTSKYIKDFGSVENYVKTTFLEKYNQKYLNRGILLKPNFGPKKEYITGELVKIEVVDNIVNPILLTVKSENKTVQVNSKNYTMQIFEPEKYYLLKNKEIGILKRISRNNKNKYRYLYEINGSEQELKYLGLLLEDFIKNKFILNSRGKSKFIELSTNNTETSLYDSIIKQKSLQNIDLNFKAFSSDNMIIKGNSYQFTLPPIVNLFYKRFRDENVDFVNHLIKEEVPLTLYTSKDPDIGIPCQFKDLTEDDEIIYSSPGEISNSSVLLRQMDAIVIKSNFVQINLNSEIGAFNKIYYKLNNRGETLNYI